jgi:hypothetical protein
LRHVTSTSSVRYRCVHVVSLSGVTCPCSNASSPAYQGWADVAHATSEDAKETLWLNPVSAFEKACLKALI